MKIFMCTLFFVTALFASNSAYERGRTLFNGKGCSNCHGTHAEGSGEFPRLANKPKKLLISKLKQFQAGISTNQNQQLMFSFAKDLNDKEVDEITTFLSNYKEKSNEKYKLRYDIMGGY